jgi:hypothetical protein
MSQAAFPNANQTPSMVALAERVGASWAVVHDALEAVGGVKGVWKFSKVSGWYLTFDIGAKRLFYCFPHVGGHLLKIVYNAKGVGALEQAGLAKDRLATAKIYSEGTVLEYRSFELDAQLLGELLRIKANSIR